MTDKKDLRAGIERMRAVAQLLKEWADDLESTLQEKQKAVAEPAAVSAEPADSAADPPSAEDVRALLAGKCAEGFRTQVQALINSYGAVKFSEVDPAHYAELVAAASLLGGDTDAG